MCVLPDRGGRMTDQEFEELWRSCFPRLVRYCQFRTTTVEEAKDVAAEAFTRLVAQSPTPRDVLPWLYRVATNLSNDDYRKRKQEAAFQRSAEPMAPRTLVWKDPDLWNAVRRLGRDQQLAVYLRLVEDLPFAQVGRLLGRSEAASKMLYRRAIDRLAQTLEAESDE